jgi:hypothetical protein
MECNIGQEAIFLLIRYIYKGRPVKISANTAFFILQRNVHEIFDTIS